MEAPLITLLTALLALSPAHATQVEGQTVPCALGDGDTQVYRLVAQNSLGWDADGARYASGGQFRTYEVSTCKNGLSLRGKDMALGLPPALKARIKPALDEITAGLEGKDAQELPAWERHGLAARCYHALGRTWTEAQLWLSASWLARDHGVGEFQGLNGPVQTRAVLESGEPELQKDLPPEVRKKVTFNLAIVAARGGYADERDRYLDAVELLGLTDEEQTRVDTLRRSAKTEAAYQDRAIDALRRVVEEGSGTRKWVAAFQLAEVLRRRGRRADARSLFQAVDRSGEAPAHVRTLARYFVEELDGEQPWTEKRYQEVTKPVTDGLE